MREIEQSVDALRRATSEMSRGLELQTEAERMGGFGTTTRDLETGEHWLSEGIYHIMGRRRISETSRVSADELLETAVHPDDIEIVRSAVATVLQDGEGEGEATYRIIRPDGEERLVHSVGKRIDATGGHAAIFLTTVVDVTPPA